MENETFLDKDSVLDSLKTARKMNVVAELTTFKNGYKVINFREFDKENVEVQLIDESMKVIPYNTIIAVRSHSESPRFPQIDQ